MATYQIKRLDCGPRFVQIAGGFVRRSQAEAHFLDYCASHKLTVIMRDIDAENDAIDIMTARGNEMLQFAIEPVREG